MSDLNIVTTGAADAPPLVLLHALGANLTFWDGFVAALGGDVRCIAYDQRGFGRSPLPERAWTVGDHVADLEAVRVAAGLERMAVMGTAVGGVIALHYAAAYPQRVSRMVFANPTRGAKRDVSLARLERMRAGGGGLDVIAQEAVATAYGPLPHDAGFTHYRDQIFLKNDPRGYERTVEGVVGTFIDPVLPQVRCPVLVAAGALDRNNTVEVAQAIADELPDGRLEVAPSAAHLGPYQAPAEYATMVRRFLGFS